jgi:glycyl-tRNA synthetase
MAEIEHFVNPERKQHPKFDKVRDLAVTLYSAHAQESGQPMKRMTIGEAVAQRVIDNETLGYFIARIYLFMTKIGIKDERLRFRQHMCTEMAHYATDCWDAECFTSYGWIECVGCADRSAYDLSRHSEATGVDLVAQEDLAAPVAVDVVEAVPVKQVMGKAYKQDAKAIMDRLAKLSIAEVGQLEAQLGGGQGQASLTVDGKAFAIPKEMVEIKRYTKTVHTHTYTPNVIEPSFGIGRILYCVLEQNFWVREGDEQRTVLSLPAPVAPIKAVILPISSQQDFDAPIRRLGMCLPA